MLDLIRTLTQVEHVRKRCLAFPGRACKSVQGLPGTSFCATSEHAKGPDAVDNTVLCSRLAVTLHLLRHPLAYRSRVASAARSRVLAVNKGLAPGLCLSETQQLLPLPGRLSIEGTRRILCGPRPLGNSLQLRNCRFHEFEKTHLDPLDGAVAFLDQQPSHLL